MMDIPALLDQYIPDPAPTLIYYDTFSLLIAVMLSAQSTDVRVNQVTAILFASAPSAQALSEMPLHTIESIIYPCGLMHRKGASIQATARILVEKYQGRVPCSLEELEALPGVGRKSALVVLSLGFGVPAFPVDTHIFRVAHRWLLSNGHTVRAVEHDLCAIFPASCWSRLHLQMIAYARRFCRAKGHIIEQCPICHQVAVECGENVHRLAAPTTPLEPFGIPLL